MTLTSKVTSTEPTELDDIPFTRFHLKMTGLTFGAHFTDGFGIGVINVALIGIAPAMALGGWWKGAIGSAMLIGLFAGSLIAGLIADKIGRQIIFTTSFVVITACTFAQFWVPVDTPWPLFILRILIGVAIGGDYAVGHTLLAELLPRKRRGELLGSFSVIWTFGYVFATILGIALLHSGLTDSWRWMLVAPGVLAALVLVFRMGTPESPRWLMRRGRTEEALAVVKKHFGDNVVLDTEMAAEAPGKFRELFGKQYLRKTVFNCVFWAAIVMPYFAIYTFLTPILASMNLSGFAAKDNGEVLEIPLSIVLLLGALLGIYLTYKLSRRAFVISGFVALTILLGIVGLTSGSMVWLALSALAMFTVLLSAVSNLVGVFPAESYPTRLRSSGVGLATAFSRFGSAASTFALPVMLTGLGLGWTMGILAGILAIGGLVSWAWAPETKGKLLHEAGTVGDH